jgi:hypothetical protein
MPFVLTTPQHVGDLNSGINVDQLEIVAISLNLQPSYIGAGGTAVLSIVLQHLASGWQVTFTYRDASALAFWGAIDPAVAGGLIGAIWNKLVADAKLPPGTANPAVPQLAAAQAAVATLAASQAQQKVTSPVTPSS